MRVARGPRRLGDEGGGQPRNCIMVRRTNASAMLEVSS
jgi:hypothetical protein